MLTCQEDGIWSRSFAHCYVTCPPVTNILNGIPYTMDSVRNECSDTSKSVEMGTRCRYIFLI